MRELYLSSPNFSLTPFEEILPQIAAIHNRWEIVGEYRHSLPLIQAKFLEITPSYSMKFQAHAPLSDINIASPNDSIREAAIAEVERCIGACRQMGIPLATIHPGILSPLLMEHREWALRNTRDSVLRISKVASDEGVALALENMPKMAITICTGLSELLQVVEGTDVKICFDTGHAHTAGTAEEFLRRPDIIGNVHLHDNEGKWDQHLPPGKGTMDFAGVFAALKGYRGNFVYETRNLEEARQSSAGILRMISGQ